MQDHSGHDVRYQFRMVLHTANIAEQWQLQGLAGSSITYPSRTLRVHRRDLAATEALLPRCTQQQVEQVGTHGLQLA